MDMSKYKFYTNDENTVVAVSSYAGRPVRGTAKCDPRDPFDIKRGQELAAARCNLKIAKKRYKRAYHKLSEACDENIKAKQLLNKMQEYSTSAVQGLAEAEAEYRRIVDNM